MGTLTEYEKSVAGRSWFRFALGLVARWRSCRQISKRISLLRKAGAKIAENVAIGSDVKAYSPQNLVIGEHCSLQSGVISAQGRVILGKHVIFGGRKLSQLHMMLIRQSGHSSRMVLKSKTMCGLRVVR